MTKEKIESEVEIYPAYCKILKKFETTLDKGIQWYQNNYPEYIKGNDFRPGTLGRFMACSISIRFGLDRSHEYIKTENWDEKFLNNYQPDFAKGSSYLGFYKDIDTMYRFYLFHSFYHQWETTIRIVHLKLGLKKGKPIDLVNKELAVYEKKFLDCLNATRNTIHNNGYYRPLGKEPEKLTYENKRFKIEFKKDEKVNMNFGGVLSLIEELIIQTEKLLKHPKVVGIPLSNDKN
jgi:hypothetical protein